jgi:hypothetical protein
MYDEQVDGGVAECVTIFGIVHGSTRVMDVFFFFFLNK